VTYKAERVNKIITSSKPPAPFVIQGERITVVDIALMNLIFDDNFMSCPNLAVDL